MLDLKSVAEAITGLAAIVAAVKSWLAHNASKTASEQVDAVRSQLDVVLAQIQTIQQNQVNRQETNFNLTLMSTGADAQVSQKPLEIVRPTEPPANRLEE